MKKVLFVVFVIFLVLKNLDALVMYGHGDALNYHLVVPKFLLHYGWHATWTELGGSLMAGYFDFIYLLPVALFSHTLKAQLLGQWLHFTCSLGLGAGLIYCFFRRQYNQSLALLAALSLLTIARSSDFFLYAKNDGVLAMLSLLVTLLIFYENFWVQLQGRTRFIVIGLLLGLIPGVKISGLIVIVPLTLRFVWKYRNEWQGIVWAAGMALLVLLPMLIRNAYYTGNPFFPGLMGLFPGNLTPSMLSYFKAHMENKMTVADIGEQLKLFFLGKAIFASIPVLMLMNWRSGRAKFNHLAAISLSIWFLYMLINGGIQSPRFLFACYFINTLFIFVSLGAWLESLNNQKSKQLAIYITLLLVILADSKIDKSIRRISSIYPLYVQKSEREVITHVSEDAKVWNYIKITPGRDKILVLSDQFSQQFYAPPQLRMVQVGHIPAAEFLVHCESEGDLSQLQQFSYAILARDGQNRCYEHIKQHGLLLTEINEYKLYQLQ